MKAYSLDLRQKIVDVYHSEDISQRKLAKRFNVAPSFVQKILKQYRETGDCGPKVRQQQTQTKLNEEQLQKGITYAGYDFVSLKKKASQ